MYGKTSIKIDYYEELKAKADFYDALMEFTKTGDARVSLTDKASDEVIPFLSRIKETKNV